MKKIYSEKELKNIVSDIEAYIEQTESAEERAVYRRELENSKDHFPLLAQTGVFHDACGKLVQFIIENGVIKVEVETEY